MLSHDGHTPKILHNPVVRNVIGFALLLVAHAIVDWDSFVTRSGIDKYTPYIFLVTLYVWIVIHNRLLFETMFLGGNRVRYAVVALAVMTIFSLNIHIIVTSVFHAGNSVSHVMSFW